ncbi:hypothetical protein OTK49_02770 [Vibrio coralliirubri]|uniref:hypothetical protein n=1 Tax=Vibrio coralliirubri TaxID=1516159 RepID=UPI0022833C06|nr:hypothetical protein [Vibrio coralliirubri]MCY9861441.1 hypothetical protein [Vibrio coralliirubri]
MHAIMYLGKKNNNAILSTLFLHNSDYESDIQVKAMDVIEEIERFGKEIFESDSLEVVPIQIPFTDQMVAYYGNLATQVHYVFNFMPINDVVIDLLTKEPIYAVEYLNGSHLDSYVKHGAVSYFQMLHVDRTVVAQNSELEIEKAIWVKYWREQKELVIPFEAAEALYGALCDHPEFSCHVAEITVNQFAAACVSKPELTNLLFSSFVLQSAMDFSADRTKHIGASLFESGYKIEPSGHIDTDIRVKLDKLSPEQESQLMDLLGTDRKGLFELFLLQPALYLESLVTNRTWLPSRCLHRLIATRKSSIF